MEVLWAYGDLLGPLCPLGPLGPMGPKGPMGHFHLGHLDLLMLDDLLLLMIASIGHFGLVFINITRLQE